MAKTLIAAAVLPLLSGCPFLPPPDTTLARGIPCVAGPIILEPTDYVGSRAARQILVINQAGERFCDWKP